MISKHKYTVSVEGAQVELRINCYNPNKFSAEDANALAIVVYNFCAAKLDKVAQDILQETEIESDDLNYWPEF